MMFKMRNSGTKGYSGYHGRNGGGKRLLILLLVLVILAGTVFLFTQRYRVYRSDGTSYIELPLPRRTGTAPDTASSAAPRAGG